MLSHFFGYFDFSGSEDCRIKIKNGLLQEATQIGDCFQVESWSQDEAFLVSNAFTSSKRNSKVSVALCGDLVGRESEKAIAELALGKIDISGETIKTMLKKANGTFAFVALGTL